MKTVICSVRIGTFLDYTIYLIIDNQIIFIDDKTTARSGA